VSKDRAEGKKYYRRQEWVQIEAVFAVLGIPGWIPIELVGVEGSGRIGAGELVAPVRPCDAFPRDMALRRSNHHAHDPILVSLHRSSVRPSITVRHEAQWRQAR
jgi:hypothetical protein